MTDDHLPPFFGAMKKYLPRDLTKAFEMMAVAEEEISKAKEREPLQSVRFDAAFRALCPRSHLFSSRHIDLYRWHVIELLDRVSRGEDLRPGTKAEVLGLLSETSLATPLSATAAVLMERLMDEVMPTASDFIWKDEWKDREEFPGATDELLAESRRAARDDSRKLEVHHD